MIIFAKSENMMIKLFGIFPDDIDYNPTVAWIKNNESKKNVNKLS